MVIGNLRDMAEPQTQPPSSMFGPSSTTTDSGIEYVLEYVAQRLASGTPPAEILSSFGVDAGGSPPKDTAGLARLVLERVHSLQDNEMPRALVCAAREGREEDALQLLRAGAAWDAIDERGHSAGAYALRDGHKELLQALLDVGSSCVLREAERADCHEPPAAALVGTHAEFMQQRLHFDDDNGRLLDGEGRPVMMDWEQPLMEAHAHSLLAAAEAGSTAVLNIGFGLGLVDAALQERRPASHTIIEAHPDVLARMRRDGWAARPGVRLLEGTWQQVLPRLCDAAAPPFDAIFFDTFAEGADELFRLHALLPRLLRPGGRFSYFNGLASHDEFLHRVYCAAVQRHLEGLGLRATFEPIAVGDRVHSEATWEGAEAGRNWWHLDTYLLPVCVRE